MGVQGADVLCSYQLCHEYPFRPLIRPGAPEGECYGEGKGDEGTGVTALYTYPRVSLDCYPLVTSEEGAKMARLLEPTNLKHRSITHLF